MNSTWTDDEVKVGLKSVVASERENLVLFFRYLIELERRELFLKEGASTVHDYCERLLGLSHGTTLKRVWVARAAARFPLILDFLADGRLTLTSVCLLVRHLSEKNAWFLLTEAVGKKEPELRWWLSTLFPEALPADWQMQGREKLVPLDGKRAKLTLIVDAEFVEKLNREKEIHKHEFPDGNALEILKKAMGEDLRRHDPKEKRKRVRKVKSDSAGVGYVSRRIPDRIKHLVAERDKDQCSYVSPSGARCTEKGGLELDHVFNWAWGGASNDTNNLRLYCQPHNRYQGRLDFNKDFRKQTLERKT